MPENSYDTWSGTQYAAHARINSPSHHADMEAFESLFCDNTSLTVIFEYTDEET